MVPPYLERLSPPITWYLVALGVVGSVFVVFIFVTGPFVAAVGAGVTALFAVAIIASQATSVRVGTDGVLTVGRSTLASAYRGAARPLDADETRAILGAKADVRAYLALRGYCPTAVRVEVEDAADPHPYWVVSTRQPRRLATALGWSPEPVQEGQGRV